MRQDRKNEDRALALALRLEGKPFSAIGAALGISRQRAQQYLRPTQEVSVAVQARANGACEDCESKVGKSGHIHHRGAKGMTADEYNQIENLTVLCAACHRSAHRDPVLYESRRKRTASEREASILRRSIKVGAARHGITPDEFVRHREQGERWCGFHKAWEPASSFIRVKAKPDGFGGRCLEGNRETVRHYQDNAYKRDYYNRNKDRLNAYKAEWVRRRREQAVSAVAS